MKIEILFKEVCNLFGEIGNISYLQKCLPNAEFIFTSLLDKPKFVDEDITFIYMGAMSEKTEEEVIKKLMPYQNRIKELIDNNTIFLFTGNALEVLGKKIINEDDTIIECLNIFDITAKRTMENRYSSLVLGIFNNIEIVGYKSQFSTPIINEKEFMTVTKELNNAPKEGINVNNFFGTSLLGPILVLNPYFTKYLLSKIGYKSGLPFEKELIEAYNTRLDEYKRKGTKY